MLFVERKMTTLYWDRGRPARTERGSAKEFMERLRAFGAVRA